MRISDWSSDVCSSDLQGGAVHRDRLAARRARGRRAVARRSSAGSLKDMLLAFGRQLLDISLSPALVGVYRIAATEYARRSAERRVGTGCVRPCRSRWSPYP